MKNRRIVGVLIAVAMVLSIMSYDFATEIGSGKFWLLLGQIGVLVASVFLIFQKDKK